MFQGKLLFTLLAAACVAAASFLLTGSVRAAEEVDLEIVLAVDASGSVDDAEFKLQLLGIAAALRDKRTQQALRSGPLGKIAVSLLIWSDAAFPKFKTPWHILSDTNSILDFADKVEVFHEKAGRTKGIGGGGTAIGDAAAYAMGMLESNGIDGLRRVIDISGDGIETPPWFKSAIQMPGARKLARQKNITINGLAILTDFPTLGFWYQQNVIVGPGSFVIEAKGFDDFKRAMREKLWREFRTVISQNNGPGTARFAMGHAGDVQ